MGYFLEQMFYLRQSAIENTLVDTYYAGEDYNMSQPKMLAV